MKDLRKIIALFIFIFVIGTVITLVSINQTLDKENSVEPTEISKDSVNSSIKDSKTV